MRRIFRGAAVFAALFLSVPAMAQDITLVARNGGLALSGQLIAYDGEFYRIASAYGPLTIDAQGVICEGPACPDLLAPLIRLRIVGDIALADRVLGPLFGAFAKGRGLVYSETPDAGARITDPLTDQTLARINMAQMPQADIQAALVTGQAEIALAYQAPPGLRARTIALEPLVLIAALEQPLTQVRSDDLAAALTGKVTNWQAIGGPDMPIVVHALPPDHGLSQAIEARLGAPLATGPRHADAEALARAVARDPWALALAGQSQSQEARALLLTDRCGFPLPATPLTVKAEDYPLTAPVFLLTPRRRLPLLMREFLEFLATDAAHNALASTGLIDRQIGSAPLTEDGQRLLGAIRNAGPDVSLEELQTLAAAMTGGERLSLTFRFRDGSADLDDHSRDNLEDLARLIATGGGAGKRLTLAGFSDGSGDPGVNKALSRDRAEAVRARLRDIAPDLSTEDLPAIQAFGEALPMACDTTPAGRQINRRVELWQHPAPFR
jgi:phosphate transport system substrate-binding protein